MLTAALCWDILASGVDCCLGVVNMCVFEVKILVLS